MSGFWASALHCVSRAFHGVSWRYMLFAVATDALGRVVFGPLALHLALVPVRDPMITDQADFAHDLDHAGHRFDAPAEEVGRDLAVEARHAAAVLVLARVVEQRPPDRARDARLGIAALGHRHVLRIERRAVI